MQVFSARNRLKVQCGWEGEQGILRTKEMLLQDFLKQVKNESENRDLLKSVTHALVLIGKTQEFSWTHNNVNYRILKLIEDEPKLTG